jgi:hypothetical protein
MLVKDAEAHFGGRSGIVKIMTPGWTKSAVYQWDDVVPLMAARRLEFLSGGALRVNYALYSKSGHIESNASA